MDRHNRISLTLLTMVAVSVAACAPLLPSVQRLPTQPEGAMSTYIAGTRAVAGTQTQIHTTPSATPTLTRTPSRTPTVTATPTSTVIFNLATITALAPPTATKKSSGGGSGGGSSGGGSSGGGSSGGGKGDPALSCRVNSTTIKVGGVVASGSKPMVPANTAFTVTWNVKNTGTEAWDHNSTDYKYLSGVVFDLTDPSHPLLYDFPDSPAKVPKGSSIDLTVSNPAMISPANSGTYSAVWTLLVGGDTKFCRMSFIIEVP